MCTVTFVPGKDHIFFTSNRDEKHWRADAHAPAVHSFPGGRILFPKDSHAGGTWIAVHENGNAIVFLNGGFRRHEPAPPYRKSRGLILLDLIQAGSPYTCFQTINLHQIEPFTAVIWDRGGLFECRWDGSRKFQFRPETSRPHIWSSVTLYDEEVIRKRAEWFSRWISKNPNPSRDDIVHFHQFTGDGDPHNDLRMNRNGIVFTVSVTSLLLTVNSASMRYFDLKNDSSWQEDLPLQKPVASPS